MSNSHGRKRIPKPCPYCGAEPVTIDIFQAKPNAVQHGFFLYCSNKNCPEIYVGTKIYKREWQAIVAWNRKRFKGWVEDE